MSNAAELRPIERFPRSKLQRSHRLPSTRVQLLLEIEQGLLAHADETLTRPVEIDDDRQHQRDRQRQHANREELPESSQAEGVSHDRFRQQATARCQNASCRRADFCRAIVICA